MSSDFLNPKGDFRKLRCFQLAEHLYDITFVFCERFISLGDRTKDQMVQAARSIKQNIAEGSCAAAMSTQSEMLLTNVGKSSQQELLLDYEDYLITRGLQKWKLGDDRLENVRNALRVKMPREFMIEKAKIWSDETIANVAITLVHQCDVMLAGLLKHQKEKFLQKGGVKEQMTKARLEVRGSQSNQRDQSSQSTQINQSSLKCPLCGCPMRYRKGKKGYFWGCSDYPRCTGTRPIDQTAENKNQP